MESESSPEAALRDAERARDGLARAVTIPRFHEELLAAAVAVQIGTTALGFYVDETWARLSLAGGVLLFGVVAALSVWRFSRENGVRLGGFASQVVLGTATTASVGYVFALIIAFQAAASELWWLVALAAVCGGVVYVLSGRRWLRAYREEPARLGGGESVLWLALLVALAVAGLVLLVLES